MAESTCPHCAATTKGRGVTCGSPECMRLNRNAKMRRFFKEYQERNGHPYSRRYAEKKRANNHLRRVTTRGGFVAERFLPGEIFERDGWRCGICGRKVGKKPWPHPLSPTLDHIIPISEGGVHSRANVRCAHLGCNSGRRERGGDEQLRLIG